MDVDAIRQWLSDWVGWLMTGRSRRKRQMMREVLTKLLLMPPIGVTVHIGRARLVGVQYKGVVGAFVYDGDAKEPFAMVAQRLRGSGFSMSWL